MTIHSWLFRLCRTSGHLSGPASVIAWFSQEYGFPRSVLLTSMWIPGKSVTMSGESGEPEN